MYLKTWILKRVSKHKVQRYIVTHKLNTQIFFCTMKCHHLVKKWHKMDKTSYLVRIYSKNGWLRRVISSVYTQQTAGKDELSRSYILNKRLAKTSYLIRCNERVKTIFILFSFILLCLSWSHHKSKSSFAFHRSTILQLNFTRKLKS